MTSIHQQISQNNISVMNQRKENRDTIGNYLVLRKFIL